MKRITEKVKDIVEVCPFTHLSDFAADPGLTLGGYHFTDITAELMAKWIDRIADVKAGQGAAIALAGFRGVGKSHFLAVVAAIVAHPELRTRINDPHATLSAERLSRRHGLVARVRRGSDVSLVGELKHAVADLLNVNAGTLGDSLHDILSSALGKAGEAPLVVLIDTELGRASRVARDDGPVLSEIADAAKKLGIFVGVALDDDISGADGANLSITASFTIDYLDQEHLYKIVDSHIFSKHGQMVPLLQEIYGHYRSVLPGFRWSEQRFTSLYPLHPAILEIAPLIRLYIHDFALLGFASEAGVKILGRPANSLIGLDEVFDSVEQKLRNVPELDAAFAAFDGLEADVITKTPVQFRHPAKLILKGLLMLSLNGQGSSVAEVAASMMIFAEPDSGAETIEVEKLLESFADAQPNSIARIETDGQNVKYRFKLASKDEVNTNFSEALDGVSDEIVWNLAVRHGIEKFGDVEASGEFGVQPTHLSVEWRGANRKGLIDWNIGGAEDSQQPDERPDWVITVEHGNGSKSANAQFATAHSMTWKIAELTSEERDTFRRYHLLQSNGDIRSTYGDGAATTIHVLSIAVENIWQRIFLQDGLLVADGFEYKFPEDSGSSNNLVQLFTDFLAPVFESRFAEHPEFSEHLGTNQASSIIADFFSGANSKNTDVQKLAETFALPLGLAVKKDNEFVLADAETLLKLDTVENAFGGTGTDDEIPLDIISAGLMAPPFGLTREAQHLILSALVAQRQFEFVTSSGNRINHRSLDLRIIWEDIVGVAKPQDELYSAEQLLSWARLITGNSGIGSLTRTEDKALIFDSLSAWLSLWKENLILAQFDALSDENLNAAIWKTAASLRKSFGAMSATIDALVKDELPLDQCLQSIAEIFSDSESEFEKKKADLQVLKDFIAGASERDEIITYLSLCRVTADEAMENARASLLDALSINNFAVEESDNERVKDLWKKFKDLYVGHYAGKHDMSMNGDANRQAIIGILNSDDWSVFESLSAIPQFDRRHIFGARELIREGRQLACGANVTETLTAKPFCTCAFDLSDFERLSGLSLTLENEIQAGLMSFQNFVSSNSKAFETALKYVSPNRQAGDSAENAGKIVADIASAEKLKQLTSSEIRLIKLAAMQIDVPHSSARTSKGVENGDFLVNDVDEWEREVEQIESFVNQ